MIRRQRAVTVAVESGVIAASVTVRDLCRVHGVPARTVVALVQEGVLEPLSGADAREWRFAASAIGRLARAMRLRRELHLDIAGTALTLELLDELQWLRNRVSLLEDLLEPRGPRRRSRLED